MTIPASYSDSRRFEGTAESILLNLERILDKVGWPYKRIGHSALGAKIPWSFWSFGEKLTVEVAPDGTVRVQSVCRFPFTVVSWGKNKRNVKRIFKALGAKGRVNAR